VRGRGAALLLCLLLLGLCWSCSSGDGNQGILDTRPRTGSMPEPQPTLPPAPYVSLTEGETPGIGQFRVNVHVQAVTDLWALAFTLEFNPAIMRYRADSAANGGFLGAVEGEDVSLEAVLEPGRSDRLVVGVSKLRQLPDEPGVTGSGSVMTLDFNLMAVGQTTVGYVLPPDANLAGIDSKDQVISSLGPDKFVPAVVVVQ